MYARCFGRAEGGALGNKSAKARSGILNTMRTCATRKPIQCGHTSEWVQSDRLLLTFQAISITCGARVVGVGAHKSGIKASGDRIAVLVQACGAYMNDVTRF